MLFRIASNNPSTPNCLKSFYDILGISRFATQEEIKKAYILRSKMMHPDRFNQSSQKAEWDMANEMLKELNHAYGVLKDVQSRAQYDSSFYQSNQAAGEGTQGSQKSESSRRTNQPTRSSTPPQSRRSIFPVLNPSFWYTLLLIGVWGLIAKGCEALKTIPAGGIKHYEGRRHTYPEIQNSAPSKIDENYPEPESGYVFRNEMATGGSGMLTIQNGNTSHAVAKLIDAEIKKSVFVVFIASGTTVTIPAIPDGKYKLIFATGYGWDDADGRFRKPEGTSAFEDPFCYSTQRKELADGTHLYVHEMTVTLNAMKGGNANTTFISPKEFDRY